MKPFTAKLAIAIADSECPSRVYCASDWSGSAANDETQDNTAINHTVNVLKNLPDDKSAYILDLTPFKVLTIIVNRK
jgi:hypothetical protein